MGSTTRIAPKANTQAAYEYVNANYGCSQLSAAKAAKLASDLDHGMRAVVQAVKENLIRVNFTGARNRLWPAGITLVKLARDMRAGDWFVDPRRPGRKLARVVQVGRQVNGLAYLILTDETGPAHWIASYDLRERLEIG
jgi:hypothetical protein